jgi:uncharacterized protein YkwD
MVRTRLTLSLTLGLSLLCCGQALASPRGAGTGMLDAINHARARHDLPALRSNRPLSRSASAFAASLLEKNVFAHANAIHARGRFGHLGEVLAMHDGSAPRQRATVWYWLRSPTHRELVLGRGFGWMGAGRAVGIFAGRSTTIWVVQLGAR